MTFGLFKKIFKLKVHKPDPLKNVLTHSTKISNKTKFENLYKNQDLLYKSPHNIQQPHKSKLTLSNLLSRFNPFYSKLSPHISKQQFKTFSSSFNQENISPFFAGHIRHTQQDIQTAKPRNKKRKSLLIFLNLSFAGLTVAILSLFFIKLSLSLTSFRSLKVANTNKGPLDVTTLFKAVQDSTDPLEEGDPEDLYIADLLWDEYLNEHSFSESYYDEKYVTPANLVLQNKLELPKPSLFSGAEMGFLVVSVLAYAATKNPTIKNGIGLFGSAMLVKKAGTPPKISQQSHSELNDPYFADKTIKESNDSYEEPTYVDFATR